MGKWLLYHTGNVEIPVPDLTRGRKNADLGQGFYTTPDREFAERWAREEQDKDAVVNCYSLDTEDLVIRSFSRDGGWAQYVLDCRAEKNDLPEDIDVVTGPIANDTLFDVMGITSGGILSGKAILALLQVGPVYTQTVIRSARAAARLSWLNAYVLSRDTLAGLKRTLRQEEDRYLLSFSEEMVRLGL